MSEQQRRHLSALVEGEIDPGLVHQTLSALASNKRLIAAWEDYHLIGAAIRSERIRPEYRLIRARVSERVAGDPPLRRPRVRRGRVFRLRPLAGTALAVCAISATIVAVPQLFNLGRDGGLPPSRHVAASAPEQFRLTDSHSCFQTAWHRWEGLEGDTHIGAVHAVGKRISDHQVTVVGEVPPETVKTVLAGIRHVPEGRQ